MLPGPAITTVIAACGIVTMNTEWKMEFSRCRITTVIAACGIVTGNISLNCKFSLRITTVITAYGINNYLYHKQ